MQPEYPDFPKEEYEGRYARAREMMKEAGLDALLITEEHNYIYFTGHRSPQNSADKIRPYIFVLPREDDGVLLTMGFELQQVREITWVEDVRTGGLMDRADFLTTVLKEKGLSKARIGAELGREQYLGISFNEFTAVRENLPEAKFADASSIFLRLRAVKSPLELRYIRKAGEITSAAMSDTFEGAASGMTQIEVGRLLRTRIAHHGGDRVTAILVHSGKGISQVPTARQLKVGDIVMIDAGVEYRSYCADLARSATVGEPTNEITEFHSWLMKLRAQCIEKLRAGNTPKDVVGTCRKIIAERGLETIAAGRIGHGVGLEVTEYPSIAYDEQIKFEPGMVFTCNPNFIRPFGFINAEDNHVIRDGPAELLSAPMAPEKLPIIRVG